MNTTIAQAMWCCCGAKDEEDRPSRTSVQSALKEKGKGKIRGR